MKPAKVVTIDESKNQVKFICFWTFAHHQARKGEWEMAARDRCRFKDRIRRSSELLNKVLDPVHRYEVYQMYHENKE